MKKKMLIGIGVFILIIGLGIGGYFHFNKDIRIKLLDENNTHIVIEINPKLMLTLDENGNVINVLPLNDDASIFNGYLIDLDLNSAINKIIELTNNSGYQTEEITVSLLDNGNTSFLEQVISTIENKNIIVNRNNMTSEEQNEMNKELEKLDKIEDLTEKGAWKELCDFEGGVYDGDGGCDFPNRKIKGEDMGWFCRSISEYVKDSTKCVCSEGYKKEVVEKDKFIDCIEIPGELDRIEKEKQEQIEKLNKKCEAELIAAGYILSVPDSDYNRWFHKGEGNKLEQVTCVDGKKIKSTDFGN